VSRWWWSPHPRFFVGVAPKGLADVISASVAFNGVTGRRWRSKPEETRSLLVGVASKGVREEEVEEVEVEEVKETREKQIPPFGRDNHVQVDTHPRVLLQKSSELLEKKRFKICVDAKEFTRISKQRG
jgi:hypothetical protein